MNVNPIRAIHATPWTAFKKPVTTSASASQATPVSESANKVKVMDSTGKEEWVKLGCSGEPRRQAKINVSRKKH